MEICLVIVLYVLVKPHYLGEVRPIKTFKSINIIRRHHIIRQAIPYKNYPVYGLLIKLNLRDGAMVSTRMPVEIRALHFGQKSFDSILATKSIFFHSIRQSDKFAASTLIFK